MDRRMWDGLVGSMRETWVATMAMGAVPPPMLMVVEGSRLVGYVQLRAVSHGYDAATAIAEMSLFRRSGSCYGRGGLCRWKTLRSPVTMCPCSLVPR